MKESLHPTPWCIRRDGEASPRCCGEAATAPETRSRCIGSPGARWHCHGHPAGGQAQTLLLQIFAEPVAVAFGATRPRSFPR